jgi:molybdopterin converting factor small subunit
MEINVLFLGVLAEVAGTHRKHYKGVTSFNDLIHRIEDDFPDLVNYKFRYALNNEITDQPPLLSDGDELVCLPPFAGG